jgi:hypothetical protein
MGIVWWLLVVIQIRELNANSCVDVFFSLARYRMIKITCSSFMVVW